MAKTKILLADDHSIVRMGISALLAYESDLAVVGEAEDGEEAVELAKRHKPDVVLMDLMMPRLDGVEATRRIREELPSCKVLILTTFGTSADVSRAIASGASGAVVKDIGKDEIVDAIRRVARVYGLDTLSEPLRDAALLRITNPAASLADLAQLSFPKVTKSCLSHRLKKLMSMAQSITED